MVGLLPRIGNKGHGNGEGGGGHRFKAEHGVPIHHDVDGPRLLHFYLINTTRP